jgi:tRNA(Ile)-lysidine synthase
MSLPPSLPERFRAHLTRARLFRTSGTALVAVSGGGDSVALLDLLHGVAPDLGLALVVAHADHGIQSGSRLVGWAVRELAAQYGLPFELSELGLGPDATETVARRARYAWLREVQHGLGAAYLVTAHHQDDQIETVVLRALRGSAPAGLAGIARSGRDGLVRPLLPFTHRELLAHVAAATPPPIGAPGTARWNSFPSLGFRSRPPVLPLPEARCAAMMTHWPSRCSARRRGERAGGWCSDPCGRVAC